MEWINATVLVGLAVFVVYQRKKIWTLEKNLASVEDKLNAHESVLASHKDMLVSQKEILSSQKDLLTSYKETLDEVKLDLLSDVPAQPAVEIAAQDDEVEIKHREDMVEEKTRFEKEVQEKTKNMDWYEKEFTIALDTILELFLHIPQRIREPIITKMPNSIIKKGFKRLSNKI